MQLVTGSFQFLLKFHPKCPFSNSLFSTIAGWPPCGAQRLLDRGHLKWSNQRSDLLTSSTRFSPWKSSIPFAWTLQPPSFMTRTKAGTHEQVSNLEGVSKNGGGAECIMLGKPSIAELIPNSWQTTTVVKKTGPLSCSVYFTK